MRTVKITDKNFPPKKGAKALPVYADKFNDLVDDLAEVLPSEGVANVNTINELIYF